MKRVLFFVLAIGCGGGEQPHAVTIAREEPKPVATAGGSLLPPRAPPAEKNACLMLFECGCNAGCTKIDHAMEGLAPGMQVTITSGGLKGTSVFVAKQQSQSGERILTIQRTDPNAPIQICAMLPQSSTLGYLCATSGSGYARTCGTCE
jgi:hypothetical protein